jgi:hypothetical protein
LDQFVEGIVDFMPQESNRRGYPNVVRFGRQCKNPKVAEFSIQNVKKNVRRHFPNPRFGVLETAMDIKKHSVVKLLQSVIQDMSFQYQEDLELEQIPLLVLK